MPDNQNLNEDAAKSAPAKAPEKPAPVKDKDGYRLDGKAEENAALELLRELTEEKTHNDDGTYTLKASADWMERAHVVLAE